MRSAPSRTPPAPCRFYATTGLSVTRESVNESENLTLAARNALLTMIDELGTRGFTRQQAYARCSVAVDLVSAHNFRGQAATASAHGSTSRSTQ